MNQLQLFARFVRRLPDYYLATKHVYLRAELGLPLNICIFDDRRFFYTPDDLNIHDLWVHHCTSFYARGEVRNWLTFSKGCQRLLDAGASAGFFSGIFNRTTEGNSQILSVEPDGKSFRLLQETIRLNNGAKNWGSVNCALSGEEGSVEFYPSDFGGNLGALGSSKPNIYLGDQNGSMPGKPEVVKVETLESLCRRQNFIPDLIKMDIESYEFETLTASSDFLTKHRPKLFLELHNEMLRNRGLDPKTLVNSLFSLGYKCLGPSGEGDLYGPSSAHLCLVA
jgi:FkbM family methyltransferase